MEKESWLSKDYKGDFYLELYGGRQVGRTSFLSYLQQEDIEKSTHLINTECGDIEKTNL